MRRGRDFELYKDISVVDNMTRNQLEEKISDCFKEMASPGLPQEALNAQLTEASNLIVEHTNRVHRDLREAESIREDDIVLAPNDFHFNTRKYIM